MFFKWVNCYLKVPSDVSSMLVFQCCLYTKINVFGIFLLLPLAIAHNQVLKLEKSLDYI